MWGHFLGTVLRSQKLELAILLAIGGYSCSQGPSQGRMGGDSPPPRTSSDIKQECRDEDCVREQIRQRQDERLLKEFKEDTLTPGEDVDDVDAQVDALAKKNETLWFNRKSLSKQTTWPHRKGFFLCNETLSVLYLSKTVGGHYAPNAELVASAVETAAVSIDNEQRIDVFFQEPSSRKIFYQTKKAPDLPFTSPRSLKLPIPTPFYPELSAGITLSGDPVLFVLMSRAERTGDRPLTGTVERFFFDDARIYFREEDEFAGSFVKSRTNHQSLFKKRGGDLFAVASLEEVEAVLANIPIRWGAEDRQSFLGGVCDGGSFTGPDSSAGTGVSAPNTIE